MEKKYWYGIAAIIILMILAILLSGCEDTYTKEEVDKSIANAVEKATQGMYTIEEVEIAKEQAKEGLYTAEELKNAVIEAKEGLYTQEELDAKILEAIEEKVEIVETKGYVIDEIEINGVVSKVLSDRQINLFDGKIAFNNKNYDAEEMLELVILQKANGIEFGANTYLVLEENGIKYSFVVESGLDTSLINEDKSLKLILLGEEIEIVEWTTDSIKLYKGDKELFEEGETKVINGIEITAKVISNNKVYFVVGKEASTIREGESREIGGMEIYVEEVFENSVGAKDFVTIKIGEKVYEEISDGDKYEEDSQWEWKIEPNKISLILSEEFKYIDEDEEFKAIGKGNQICLPNNYVCLVYDGLVEEKTEGYRFKTYTRGGEDYIRVDGEFISGLKDYTRVYIDSTGIYDKNLELIDLTTIELGDTEMSLTIVGDYLVIDDIKLKMDFTQILVNTLDISGNDYDYLTDYGIIIKTPEDSLDNEDLRIVIPTEQVTGSITFIE